MKTSWDQDQYIKTHRFAAEAHHGQTVTGTELPYLVHIHLVTMEVLGALAHESFNNGNLAMQAALLHDTIEDTAVTYEQVSSNFGKAVADGVLALTKDESLPKEAQMGDSLARIKQQPKEVWLVKLADRIINLAPPPAKWTSERIAQYKEEAKLIHAELHPASPYLAGRLLYKINLYPPEIT